MAGTLGKNYVPSKINSKETLFIPPKIVAKCIVLHQIAVVTLINWINNQTYILKKYVLDF